MTSLLNGFHPSFDALSAHADRLDMSAARTRVGRHVSRCSACAQTVTEIRALGESARQVELPGAPSGLWERIEAGVRGADREISRPVSFADRNEAEDARSPRSTRSEAGVRGSGVRGSSARLGLGLLIAAGTALVAVLLVSGTKQDLGAAPPRRLTLDRLYVIPGAAIRMRYRPAPSLADQQTVTVWARYTRHKAGEDHTPSYEDGLTRAGVLRRSSAQQFVGAVTFPTDARVAQYAIGDSLGFVIDRVPVPASAPRMAWRGGPGSSAVLATVLAADASGRPTFDALVTFLGEMRPSAKDDDVANAVTQLAKLYPDRPETWILTYPSRHRGVVGDIVKLFESRERAYDGWDDRLKARRMLSLETELLMASIAADLEDTARADFWVERLVREHGSSPAVPDLWISRYRDATRDSIPAILAAFEPIWQAAGGVSVQGRSRALALAERSGDAELQRRWRTREAEVNPYWVIGAYSDAWLSDSTTRVELGRLIREQLGKEMRDTLAAPTLGNTARWVTNLRLSRRQLLRTRLAAIQLLDGDVRGARAVLDSLATVADTLLRECPSTVTLRWRAEAERRLGELDAARDDLAYVATAVSVWDRIVGDSAPQLLGAAYTPESWAKARQVAAGRHRSCFAAYRDRMTRTGG